MGGPVRQVQGPRRAAPLNEGRPRPSRARADRTGEPHGLGGCRGRGDRRDRPGSRRRGRSPTWPTGRSTSLGDTVELSLTRNGGSAFSRFQGITPILAVGAIIVTVVLVRVLRSTTDRVLVIALTLVLGGALGNLMDRFFRAPGFLRGHVVDFVAVGWWPVFNVADSCVTIGAVLLVLRSLRAAAERVAQVSEPIPVPADARRRAHRPGGCAAHRLEPGRRAGIARPGRHRGRRAPGGEEPPARGRDRHRAARRARLPAHCRKATRAWRSTCATPTTT